MRLFGLAALLLLASGCAATRVVTLDTGHEAPIVYRPVDTAPIELDAAAFNRAVSRLVLDVNLNVEQEIEEDRFTLLAFVGGVVDGARGRKLNLLAGELTRDPTELRLSALSFAFDTVWEGVEAAVGNIANPAILRAMVVSMIGTALVMVVAPEPITKLAAVAMVASLIAYLGTGPV